MRAVGFEPTPLSRLAPEASALDHSAKLPIYALISVQAIILDIGGLKKTNKVKLKSTLKRPSSAILSWLYHFISSEYIKDLVDDILGQKKSIDFGGSNLYVIFRTRGIDERNHNCECGQLETVEHVLKECPLHPAERDLLRKVSPELDPKILLDTKKGLGAVVKFLDSLPQLLC